MGVFFDAESSTIAIDISDVGFVAFSTTVGNDPTFFDWSTTGGNVIFTEGAGNTFNGASFPTGGTTTTIGFGGIPSSGTEDAIIALLSVPTTDLVSTGNAEESANLFWSTVLRDNDTIIAPNSQDAFLAGDISTLNQALFDTLSGGTGSFISGDDFLVGGASASAQTLIGDGDVVDAVGSFRGGGDTITLSTGDGVTYGASTAGISQTRNPDLFGAFSAHDVATGSSGNASPGFRLTGASF